MNESSSPYDADSLDPLDWPGDIAAGHRMLDEMVEHLRTIRERPIWRRMSEEIRNGLHESAPMGGASLDAVYEQFKRDVLPYGLGNTHPRFWGWVIGTGTVAGVFADLVTSAMNTNSAGFQSSAVTIEDEVIGWFRDMLEFPRSASGALTTGGSVANLICMAAGLYAGDRKVIRQHGILGAGIRPTIYTSTQTHFSVVRAARILGLGDASVRKVPANHLYQIDTSALQKTLDTDRANGYTPIMIAAHTGTVGVGAFDPLNELADIARTENLWLHVDAAFGGFVLLHEEIRARATGIERADSVAIDLHKWLHVPIDAACVVIRDAEAHRSAFGIDAPYLADVGGVAVDANRYTNLGIQQSRSARAVKVWFLVKHFGLKRLGEMVYKNVRQAEMLGRQVADAPDFELCAPVQSNIVCFRYYVPGLSEEALNELNRRLIVALYENGDAIPSPFSLGDRFVVRCCITNHRTTDDDLRYMLGRMRDSVAAESSNQVVSAG